MVASQNGINLTKREELCELSPYLDSTGKPTIGWGNTYYQNGVYVQMTDPPITQAQADALLMWAVDIIDQALNAILTGVTVNQNQYDSLSDFCYNLGPANLHSSTLLRLIKGNVNDPGIKAAFLLWDKEHIDGVLTFSQDLYDRRLHEYALYSTPLAV